MTNKFTEKKELKRQLIINNARLVFSEKGYTAVTMKDIIEKSNISRGGIYLYFSSVEEVFLAVLNDRSNSRFKFIYELIEKDESFNVIIHKYMEEHKERLLNEIDTSLLRATYEYYFFNNLKKGTSSVQTKQLKNIKKILLSIFDVGINKKEILPSNIDAIVNQFALVIEGLSILALTHSIDEQLIDKQFSLLLSLVYYT